MDPFICPMCEGAVPGNEITQTQICGECGADLSKVLKQRAATLAPPPPSRASNQLMSQAAVFSLIAPCFSVVLNVLGRQAVVDSDMGKLALGTVCGLFIVAGFILGIVAFFSAGKDEGRGKAIGGICLNGILIGFAILNVLAYQE